MPETKLSLHRKLAQVMYEAERIPKNGQAPKEMGGYPFVQVGDAADYIRKALAEKVLTMMPVAVNVVGQVDRPTKSGGNMTTLDLITTWRITDGESGESIEIQSFGAGADGGDKYSGKAMTSAMKYALLSGFLLSTGEDTEASKLPEQRSPQAMVYSGSNPPPPAEPTNPDGSLIGTVELGSAGAKTDYNLRQTPQGFHIGFRLISPKGGIKVVAYDALAEALALVKDDVVGQRVTAWGRISDETFTPQGSKKAITYQVLTLERIQTPTVILPAPDAPTEALFSDEEMKGIEAAIGA
jgi:ERF superfamily